MKKIQIWTSIALCGLSSLLGQTAVSVGTVIPEEVTFSMSPTSPSQLSQTFTSGTTFSDLVRTSYGDFDGEVLAAVYFAAF